MVRRSSSISFRDSSSATRIFSSLVMASYLSSRTENKKGAGTLVTDVRPPTEGTTQPACAAVPWARLARLCPRGPPPRRPADVDLFANCVRKICRPLGDSRGRPLTGDSYWHQGENRRSRSRPRLDGTTAEVWGHRPGDLSRGCATLVSRSRADRLVRPQRQQPAHPRPRTRVYEPPPRNRIQLTVASLSP